MKKITAISALSTLAVAALIASGHAAAQSNGTTGTATINFSGALTAVTCTVTSGAGANNTTVLPTMPTSSLTAANAVAGKTPFTINVTGCTGNNSANPGVAITIAVPYFDVSNANILADNNLANTLSSGNATNVELQILDAGTNNPVLLKAPWGGSTNLTLQSASQGQKVTPQTLSSAGAATFPFYVQYFATGQTTAGQVASSVPVIMQYN